MPSTGVERSPAPADRPRRALRTASGAAACLLLAASWLLFVPPGVRFASHPHPASDYDEALRRVELLRAADSGDLNPVCRLELMSHGRRTGRAVVLLHGLTNC